MDDGDGDDACFRIVERTGVNGGLATEARGEEDRELMTDSLESVVGEGKLVQQSRSNVFGCLVAKRVSEK
jgi:hypothetical protein